MFAEPQVRKMARRTDPATSKATAVGTAEIVTTLQLRVFKAFQQHGAMSAKQAEKLPEFGDLGFSTVRKRCSELAAIGWLRDTGEVEDGCTVYACSREGNRRGELPVPPVATAKADESA